MIFPNDLNDAIHKHLTHELTKEILDETNSEKTEVIQFDDYVSFAKTVKQKDILSLLRLKR